MNKHVALISLLIIVAASAHAQQQGIGLRLGLPTGITYKRFLSDFKAVEFGLGTTPNNMDNRYYKNSFKHMSRYDKYNYNAVNVSSSVYMQARMLFHYDLDVTDVEGKFQWYWGAGAMLKFAKVDYWYFNPANNNEYLHDKRTDVDFGPEGIFGVEYTFEDLPLSLFAETSLQLEFVDRFTFRLFAGTGARYRF